MEEEGLFEGSNSEYIFLNVPSSLLLSEQGRMVCWGFLR